MRTPSRYHPALVAIHWIVAVLIIADLAIGTLVLAHIPNASPKKLEGLRAHFSAGLLILFLMTLRLAVRLRSARPPEAPTGSRWLDRLAWASHRLLYIAAFGLPISGLIMGLQARLPQVLFLHQGALPASFWAFPLRYAHLFFARLLMGLIALHVSGAAYHVLVRRDGLLARMWFGRRYADAAAEGARHAPPIDRAAPWLSGLVLAAAAALLAAISLKFIFDPRGAAAASGIILTDPLGFTDTRAGFGGFSLAFAAAIGFCLIRGRRTAGLALVATVIGVVLAARLYGVAIDRTFAVSARLIAPEAVLLVASLAALALERRRAATASASAPARPLAV